MDFGCEEEKKIQLSEETFWSINCNLIQWMCVVFWWTNCFVFKLMNYFYQFSNFVLKKWKTKKRDEKSKNVFINSAILLFLFKPLPLFFMLLNSQKHYWTCVFEFYTIKNFLKNKFSKFKKKLIILLKNSILCKNIIFLH